VKRVARRSALSRNDRSGPSAGERFDNKLGTVQFTKNVSHELHTVCRREAQPAVPAQATVMLEREVCSLHHADNNAFSTASISILNCGEWRLKKAARSKPSTVLQNSYVDRVGASATVPRNIAHLLAAYRSARSVSI